MFQGFETRLIKALGIKFKSKLLPKSAYIFKEGDPASKIYLVRKGEFKVTKKLLKKDEHGFQEAHAIMDYEDPAQ